MKAAAQYLATTKRIESFCNQHRTLSKRERAVIVFTDVVGYTKLLEQGPEEALQLLEINRKLHKQLLAIYNGIWIKEMGDGILARFQSIEYAVNFALSLQNAVKPIPSLRLRIGLHTGDVMVTKDDVFGMAVNIAARIQCIAKPGQILISGKIAEYLHQGEHVKVKNLGYRRLKNVKTPVQLHWIGENLDDNNSWFTQIPYKLGRLVVILLTFLSFQ